MGRPSPSPSHGESWRTAETEARSAGRQELSGGATVAAVFDSTAMFFDSTGMFHGRNGVMSAGAWPPFSAQLCRYRVSQSRGFSVYPKSLQM